MMFQVQFRFLYDCVEITVEHGNQGEGMRLYEYEGIKPQHLKFLYKEIIACLKAELLYKNRGSTSMGKIIRNPSI